MRIRIDLAYDGTDFSGWARQPGLRTVQGELERALATVLRTPPPSLTVGGRTDAGVHARGSVAHLDVDEEVWRSVPGRSDREPGDALVTRLRGVLPPDVVVRSARVVPDGFDARFSALRRRYTYRLADRPERLDPLRRHDTVVVRRPLDAAAMDAAASRLVGLHDFAAFCKPREGATTVRTLLAYRWERDDEGIVVGTVQADAFCHSMVRALVGGVVPVGEGRRAVDWPEAVLLAGVRDSGVQVMPPHGLCLEEIVYPETETALAERAAGARALRVLPAEPPGQAQG
ncbi:tRNA pseudouridine(38-40) synthase TruA [Ornithinimicrobium tianjinense]|uniref:tRNA pseudouridine synthase A n=1 Tax=Ornithinimicrobium tianjinense TaxID=1195761 RepID=A0A917BQ62_9MICO|nr:tRNA pseudouridine(38-40) synthase TruA [Ornithinimicrobium tianjinense]GGF54663.1 tRNA pseudouridine synthase A [Ornithinimicrobium tianjinense]